MSKIGSILTSARLVQMNEVFKVVLYALQSLANISLTYFLVWHKMKIHVYKSEGTFGSPLLAVAFQVSFGHKSSESSLYVFF